MKRFMVLLPVILLSLSVGCTSLFFGKPSAQLSGLAEEQEMVKIPENGQINNCKNCNSEKVSREASSGVTEGVLTEAGATTATGVTAPPTVTEVLDSASASSATSESAGSHADSDAPLPAQATDDTGTAIAETRIPVTVYYQDRDGYLIPMTRWIQMQQGIAKAAVSLNVDSAVAREEVAYYGVYPVMPMGTDILGIDIKDGIATIDFDRHLLSYGNAASERNIIAAIVYTLTEFKTIGKVQILINGYMQGILKYGTNISGALERKDVIINNDASLQAVGSGKADVFLYKMTNEGFTYLVPVSVTDSAITPENMVKRLLGINAEGGLYTEIPDGAKLLECRINNDVLTLNFNNSFSDYVGNEKDEGILKQLAYTLRQVEGIRKLKILIEGRKLEMSEGADISAGLVIPATINDVIDR